MKQVLDIKQMQHLQELGLDTSNASMLHCEVYDAKPILVESKHKFHKVEDAIIIDGVRDSVIYCKKVTPAYTLQDVLNLLPKEIKPAEKRHWLRIDLADECIYYYHEGADLVEHRDKVFLYGEGEEMIDVAYNALCWCIENGYVVTEKEDKK